MIEHIFYITIESAVYADVSIPHTTAVIATRTTIMYFQFIYQFIIPYNKRISCHMKRNYAQYAHSQCFRQFHAEGVRSVFGEYFTRLVQPNEILQFL